MTIDLRKDSRFMTQKEWERATKIMKLVRDYNATPAGYLYARSIDELGQGDLRASIDLSWQAFQQTPPGSYMRFHVFQHHCRILVSGSSALVSLQDTVNLQQVSEKDPETICRVEALQVLGQINGILLDGILSLDDFDASSEYYKKALAVARQAKPEELQQKIFLNESYDVLVGDVLEEFWWRCSAMISVANTKSDAADIMRKTSLFQVEEGDSMDESSSGMEDLSSTESMDSSSYGSSGMDDLENMELLLFGF